MRASYAKGKCKRIAYYHCYKKGCPRHMKKVLEPKFHEYLQQLRLKEQHLAEFERKVIAAYNAKTKHILAQNRQIEKEIEMLNNKKSRLINTIAEGKISEEDILPELGKVKKEIAEKGYLLSDTKNTPNIEVCWTYVKNLINNLADVWAKAENDLDLRQRVQGLIMPDGFKFEGDLIQPLKNPYIIKVFKEFEEDYKTKRPLVDTIRTKCYREVLSFFQILANSPVIFMIQGIKK